jgi:divalent metal cation (Fe/Co/Zn/Cd) transporter
MLMGEAAPADVVRKLTYVTAHHHPLIKAVNRVISYQLGPMYFAEVDVVMRDGISLEAATWVGDSLRKRLSRLADIEQVYVRLDTSSHDEELSEILDKGSRLGLKYSRDQRGQIVFELVSDDSVL